MKKMRVLAVMAAAMIAMTSCGNGALKDTAMEVGGVKVSGGDVAVMAQAQMAYGATDFEATAKSIANQIKISFEYGELGKAMGVELTDEDKAQAVAMRAQYATANGGYEAYAKYLKKNGSSIEFLDELFTASAYSAKVTEEIKKEFEGKDATDDELKKFYDKSYYRAKHVLVAIDEDTDEKAAEKLANEYLARAEGGEDFDKMVTELSEDPGTETNPDGYTFTDGEMVTEFEDTVKSLKAGEIGICKSSYGYHIIRREELGAFEDNKDKVAQMYSSNRIETRFSELLKEHKIESKVNDDVIAALKADMLSEAPKSENATMEY